MPVSAYLIVSALLFTIGAVGVLVRRNPLVMFMSIELMLNAVNLSFMAFARYLNSVEGWIFVFLVKPMGLVWRHSVIIPHDLGSSTAPTQRRVLRFYSRG